MENLSPKTRYKLLSGENRANKLGGRANARDIWTAGRIESRRLWLEGMTFLYSIHEEISEKLLALRRLDARFEPSEEKEAEKTHWIDLEDNKKEFPVGYFDNLGKN